MLLVFDFCKSEKGKMSGQGRGQVTLRSCLVHNQTIINEHKNKRGTIPSELNYWMSVGLDTSVPDTMSRIDCPGTYANIYFHFNCY